MRDNTIKHISFDVWGTLVAPNPEFAAARTAYLANVLDVPYWMVQPAYTAAKQWHDNNMLQSGQSLTAVELVNVLFAELKIDEPAISAIEVAQGIQALFHTYQPIVFADTIRAMVYLKDAGYTLSISSNTGFVAWSSMARFLTKTFGEETFEFFVFSDLEGVGKPEQGFFQRTINGVQSRNPDVTSSQILHVGNDKQFDIPPAPMRSWIIDSPEGLGSFIDKFLRGDIV